MLQDWPLYDEGEEEVTPEVPDSVFSATAVQLHRVLLSKARIARDVDPAKSERLSRLAERRARDGKKCFNSLIMFIRIKI